MSDIGYIKEVRINYLVGSENDTSQISHHYLIEAIERNLIADWKAAGRPDIGEFSDSWADSKLKLNKPLLRKFAVEILLEQL